MHRTKVVNSPMTAYQTEQSYSDILMQSTWCSRRAHYETLRHWVETFAFTWLPLRSPLEHQMPLIAWHSGRCDHTNGMLQTRASYCYRYQHMPRMWFTWAACQKMASCHRPDFFGVLWVVPTLVPPCLGIDPAAVITAYRYDLCCWLLAD